MNKKSARDASRTAPANPPAIPPICAPVSFDDATAVPDAPVADAATPDVDVDVDVNGIVLDAGVEAVGATVGVVWLVVHVRLELELGVVVMVAAVVEGSGKTTAPVGGTIRVAIIVPCVSDAALGSLLHMSYASETMSAVQLVSTIDIISRWE